MKLYKFLTLSVVIISLALTAPAYSKELSKKELKSLKKSYNMQLNKSKKMLSDGKKVAILGNTIAFRTEGKVTAMSSNKDDLIVKGAGIAQLKGVPDSVFQEITEEYNNMVVARLNALGVDVIPVSEMQKKKSFKKLVGDAQAGNGTVWEDSKKNWGVSKNAVPVGQYSVWYNYMKPFGAHAKLPKELKAALFNSFLHINFAVIDVTASGNVSKKDQGHSIRTTKTTSRNTNVTPLVFIDNRSTTTLAQPPKAFANFNIIYDVKTGRSFGREHAIGANSSLDYAKSVETCTNCTLGFESKSFLNEGDVKIYKIDADPALYKKAALEALGKHLDKTFALYLSK